MNIIYQHNPGLFNEDSILYRNVLTGQPVRILITTPFNLLFYFSPEMSQNSSSVHEDISLLTSFSNSDQCHPSTMSVCQQATTSGTYIVKHNQQCDGKS